MYIFSIFLLSHCTYTLSVNIAVHSFPSKIFVSRLLLKRKNGTSNLSANEKTMHRFIIALVCMHAHYCHFYHRPGNYATMIATIVLGLSKYSVYFVSRDIPNPVLRVNIELS